MFDSLTGIPIERRWREQTLPAPIVAAIIRRPGKDAVDQQNPSFLLIRRAGDPYRGRWALVGGKWDFGETLQAAAVREVKEETGLKTDFVALRGIVSERLAPAEHDGSGAAHFLILVCQMNASDDRASEQEEGAVAWFSWPQIEDLQRQDAIIPSDYLMLERFTTAANIPHHEADMMFTMGKGNDELGPLNLVRFAEAG